MVDQLTEDLSNDYVSNDSESVIDGNNSIAKERIVMSEEKEEDRKFCFPFWRR